MRWTAGKHWGRTRCREWIGPALLSGMEWKALLHAPRFGHGRAGHAPKGFYVLSGSEQAGLSLALGKHHGPVLVQGRDIEFHNRKANDGLDGNLARRNMCVMKVSPARECRLGKKSLSNMEMPRWVGISWRGHAIPVEMQDFHLLS